MGEDFGEERREPRSLRTSLAGKRFFDESMDMAKTGLP